jgi:hypothetical protein
MLTYTDTDAIERRLVGRLTIGGPQSAYAKQSVDPNLLAQIGMQVEAKINASLSAMYVFPLKLTDSRPLLSAIAEKGVVCELADVHFFNSEEGTSYGTQMCKQFHADLSAIVEGKITLPGESFIATLKQFGGNPNVAVARSTTAVEALKW